MRLRRKALRNRKKRVLWERMILRKIVVLAGVLGASWLIEILTMRSHVLGKGSELVIAAIVDHTFFGVPVDE